MIDLFAIDPDLDRWVDNNCIITREDRVDAILNGEAMYAEVVVKKLVELTIEREDLLRYARELKDDLEEYHAQFKDDPIAQKYNMGLVLSQDKPALMNRKNY